MCGPNGQRDMWYSLQFQHCIHWPWPFDLYSLSL